MSAGSLDRQIEILLVEDNPADVRLTREALKEVEVPNHLSVVGDGVEALDFLRREGHYASAVRPDLVILDLRIPKKGGHELLAEIKGDHDLKNLAVVVFSTSQAEQDILRSYELQASAHVTKPGNLGQFLEVIRGILGWFANVKRSEATGEWAKNVSYQYTRIPHARHR